MLLQSLYFPLTAVFVAVSVTVLGLAACVAWVFRAPLPVRDGIMRLGCDALLFAMRARPFILATHSDPRDWPREMIWVSNHESLADAPALVHALRTRSLRFVAKKPLFLIPVFGWALYALKMVPVTRRGGARDFKNLNAFCRGMDLLFFAEGTRSKTGQLQAFKKGAVVHAIHTGLPIMPVAVVGGFECLKPKSLRIRGGHVAVVVGRPIETAGTTDEDRGRLLAEVQEAVRALRAQGLAALDLPRPPG